MSEQSDDGVFVLDHPSALVYCVPGRGHGHPGDVVVMTRTAREALTDEQLELVLSHERAHLRSRHGKLVERSRALASALPFLPFFRVAHEQIAELAEMHADDAVEPDHRRALADALYRLSVANRGGTLPSGTLGAAGPSVVVRARRLLLPREPLKHTVVAVIAAMIVGIATAPLALAFLPAGTGISHDCCVVGVEQTAAEEIPAPVRIAGLRVRL
ncbi:MAG: M56 family metallopeptidase [Nocardioidaceae bacterium]|nr:MAG: M56 family metallopeptidase [Nocardioidaceae bacterium]